ncbi:MAG: glycoside hydrolase family 6 protein [Stackebrandtia sp.]
MKLKTAALAGLAAVAVAVPVTMTLSAQAEEPEQSAKLAGEFYVDPENNAQTWVDENPDSPAAEQIQTEIADNVVANWYGDWENPTPLKTYVADAAEAGGIPVVVAYNMYQRDCNGQSGGGADDKGAYKEWIEKFAADLGDSNAYVIVEPDAVSQMVEPCDELEVDTRKELLAYAVDQLSTKAPNASVYLDAGNAGWPADNAKIATALKDAGIEKIRGFAMNTSNHYTTEENDEKAAALLGELGTDSGYVVDTSRNGSGKPPEAEEPTWCNPKGATLGETSTEVDGPADAHLWTKVPGDSDGDCGYGKGLEAGQFSDELALPLITGDYPDRP